jgi:glutamyl-tRNA synthetase
MVRTRFAPSPTGNLHIGGARTALFNYLFAKKNNGSFILRIEDTDFERSNPDFEKSIMNDLKWLRIEWDEGPDKGGKFAPYRQSERLDLYKAELKKLIDKGLAYECYCTEEELEIRRKIQLKEKKPPVYDRRCLNLTDKQKQQFINEGRKPSYRFFVSNQILEYHDLIHGNLKIDTSLVSDPIIVKSNGVPTYNFACVVDDHYMNITHVIRGDEHLDNTPRQILIYRALDYEIPYYAHIPMILSIDRSKLSKRHGATSVKELKDLGFVPEAVVNYISLLGWSPKENREVFSIEELIQRFSIDGILDHPAVYDLEKMKWFNHYYISSILNNQKILEYLSYFGDFLNDIQSDKILEIISLEKNRVYLLTEFIEIFELIKNDDISYDFDKVPVPDFISVLKSVYSSLEEINFSNIESVKSTLKIIQQRHSLKTSELYKPLRFALTNKLDGIELPKLIYFLGKEKFFKRLNSFLNFVSFK